LEEGSLSSLEVPASIAVVLRNRIEKLSETAREVARWLAVFRRPMPAELLRGLEVYNAEQLETALRELIDRQIVIVVAEGGERSYMFRHASIAELIRTHTAETKRRRMHGRIAAV